MRGFLQKKGDIYYIVFDLERHPVTGKRQRKWIITGTGNKKEAGKKLAEMSKEINAGEYTEPSDLTVAEFLEKWLALYAKNNVRSSTYDSYVWAAHKYLIPELGRFPLVKLRPLQIQELLNKEMSHLSASSVHKLYALLRQAIDHAIKWQICTINPCHAVTPPRREKYRGQVYNPDQLSLLLDAVANTKVFLPIIIATTCGLRRGEICALRWCDVEMEKSLLLVGNSLDWEDKKLTLRPVKTTTSARVVKLPSIALEALKIEKRRQAEDKLRAGGLYEDKSFCWAWDDGRPHDPDYLYKEFRKILESNNLPRIRFHDLRHSHATALLLEGVSVKVISERLGHSSTTITQDIYSHVLPQMQEEAANVMDKLFSKNQIR